MRYTVEIDFYIHADNDEQAKKKAEKIVQKMRDKKDNQANVLAIYETPFGSMTAREILNKK